MTIEKILLSDWSCIAVEGKDALAFLQGQLTQDLRTVTAATPRWAAYCNPKGRVLAVLGVFGSPTGFVLALPRALTSAIMQRLSLFVLRSAVKICENVNIEVVGLKKSQKIQNNDLIDKISSLPISPTLSLSLTAKGESQAEPEISPSAWLQVLIEAQFPLILPETSGEFIPQDLNLCDPEKPTCAVSFTKGCYVGQEIVARVQHLGKSKKQLLLVTLARDAPLPKISEQISGGTVLLVGDRRVLLVSSLTGL